MAKHDLAGLPGFGDTTAQWLLDVGIESFEDIDRLGSLAVTSRQGALISPGPWAARR